MKKQNQKCTYSILEKLVEGNTESEFFDHLVECSYCQNQIMKLDEGLIYYKFWGYQSRENNLENESSATIEEILSGKNRSDMIKTSLINPIIEQIEVIKNYDESRKVRTPEYLKQIIDERLQSNKESNSEKIIIKISDGLKILGNYIENMFVIPDLDNAIPVRSGHSNNNPTTLNFFQLKGEKEVIRYHVVQDGPESILLTVKLENFESQPLSLTIRNKSQLVASQPFTDNYAYFHKLKTGDYQFEVSFNGDKSGFVIPFFIIQ